MFEDQEVFTSFCLYINNIQPSGMAAVTEQCGCVPVRVCVCVSVCLPSCVCVCVCLMHIPVFSCVCFFSFSTYTVLTLHPSINRHFHNVT